MRPTSPPWPSRDCGQAELAEDILLERCSNKTPELRLRRIAALEEVEDKRDELESAREEAGGRASKLAEAQNDLEAALKSESDTVESSAFGAKATYPVAEFRALVERQVFNLGGKQLEALAKVTVRAMGEKKRPKEGELAVAKGRTAPSSSRARPRAFAGAAGGRGGGRHRAFPPPPLPPARRRCRCRRFARFSSCPRCPSCASLALRALLPQVRRLELVVKNVEDELADLEHQLTVETGELMNRAVNRAHLIRCMGPNQSNLFANDVTGEASGGVKLAASSVDSHACVYDLETGALMQVGRGNL